MKKSIFAHLIRLAAWLPLIYIVSVSPAVCMAGGPKAVAGVSYFNAGVVGQPIHWNGGQVNYFVDEGALSSTVSNEQATAMVDAAAAMWSAVPTAGVTLTDKGGLGEDVNGASVVAMNGKITAPANVTAGATSFPIGVIYDADGSVIDATFGASTSMPTSCQNNGVFTWMDEINPDATIGHAVMILNGRCATSPAMVEMMSYEIERGFGRLLGLDYAQVNPTALTDELAGGTQGWPVMQPLSGVCSQAGGECIPDANVLRYDDIAALNRIYPITAANLSQFSGKELTAANTVSIKGTVNFRGGMGMQGVNVVARPLDANGDPMYQYTVTFVTGAYFNGKHGNAISGYNDANGNALSMWGSHDAAMQGYFDLSDMPLPAGVTTANYQVTFEAINPLYILGESVGAYVDGQVTPSGTLAPIAVNGLAAGGSQTLTVEVQDSAISAGVGLVGKPAAPRAMTASGMWSGRLSHVGQTDWFSFAVRGGRTFTVVAQALDQAGVPTNNKAIPAIGVWNGSDAVGAAAVATAPGFDGDAVGESYVQVSTDGAQVVRIGVADKRGDGRPDYSYKGWVLYADTVSPTRIAASGGTIVIHGVGFRAADTVKVGGVAAQVISISANEITAIAAPAATGVSGSVDVEVDDLAGYYAAAVISGGVSYNSGDGDSITLLTAPMGTIATGVPVPFTVTALGEDLNPAGGVTVIYTVTSGTAKLGCGAAICSVTSTGDGRATMNVTAPDTTWSIVTASLTNGAKLQAQFVGGAATTLAALTQRQSVAAGATISWTVQALALRGGFALSGQTIAWQTNAAGFSLQGAAGVTGSDGVATQTLTVGPLAEGQLATINACLNGSNVCVTFSAIGARTEYAMLEAVSGTTQSLSAQGTASPIVMRLLDMNGNPMAAGTVTLYETLDAWTPVCSRHSVCGTAKVLAQQTVTATSALDGTVTFTPASMPGVATNLVGLAVSGNTATLKVAVEQHP